MNLFLIDYAGNFHLFDNRFFFFRDGTGHCVTAMVRDATLHVLHINFVSPCGGARNLWLAECRGEQDPASKGRLAEMLVIDSIVCGGLPVEGGRRLVAEDSVAFTPGHRVAQPLPGTTALYIPTDHFWPYIDAVFCAPQSLPGPQTHGGKKKEEAAPANNYTHFAIQVTLEEPKGRKRTQAVRFFAEHHETAWSGTDGQARWCLLWVTPHRKGPKKASGTDEFGEVFVQFGDISADLDFLNKY